MLGFTYVSPKPYISLIALMYVGKRRGNGLSINKSLYWWLIVVVISNFVRNITITQGSGEAEDKIW